MPTNGNSGLRANYHTLIELLELLELLKKLYPQSLKRNTNNNSIITANSVSITKGLTSLYKEFGRRWVIYLIYLIQHVHWV